MGIAAPVMVLINSCRYAIRSTTDGLLASTISAFSSDNRSTIDFTAAKCPRSNNI
jgi:hypothetical protein